MTIQHRHPTSADVKKPPSVDAPMKLIGELSGWSRSAVVEVCLMPDQADDDSDDDSYYDTGTFTYKVAVNICGETTPSGPMMVRAAGKDLPSALLALAQEVNRTLGLISCRATERAQKAHKALVSFIGDYP